MGRHALQPGDSGAVTVGRHLEGWQGRVRVRLLDGTYRDVRRFGATRREATINVEQGVADVLAASGGARITRSTPVHLLGKAWVDSLPHLGLKQSSQRAYQGAAERYMIPLGSPLASLALWQVTAGRVEQALRQVGEQHGAATGKILHTVYRGAFDLAVQHEALPVNPARSARFKPSTAKQPVHERDAKRALTDEEFDRILEFARSNARYIAYGVTDLIEGLAGTGCRIGELCALQWHGVNFEAGTIRVPAVKTAERVIYPAGWLMRLLDARKPPNHATSKGHVFASSRGRMRDVDAAVKTVSQAFTRAGMPWASSHTFRRTVATRLDRAGLTPREIANHLGHAQPTMTLDVYMDRTYSPPRAADVL